jgi:hypothetical protein
MNPQPNEGQRWRESRAGKVQTDRPTGPKPADQRMAGQDQVPLAGEGQPGPSPRVGSQKRAKKAEETHLAIDKAIEEVTRIPAAIIHRNAAFTWAARAIACYRVSAGQAVLENALSYLYLGEHYREAALAHAAMGEGWQPLYAEIDDAMANDRAGSFASVRRRSGELGRGRPPRREPEAKPAGKATKENKENKGKPASN